MAQHTAVVFHKFDLLSADLRYSVWEALWDITKNEERTKNLMIDCMRKGRSYILFHCRLEDRQWAACAESRREYLRLFFGDFSRTAREIQPGLVALGCKNTTLPRITTCKALLGCYIDTTVVYQAYFQTLYQEDRYNVDSRP
jgi:hypothetical protein